MPRRTISTLPDSRARRPDVSSRKSHVKRASKSGNNAVRGGRLVKGRHRFSFWQYFFLAAVGFTTIIAAICVGVFLSFVNSLPPLEELERDPPETTRVVDRYGAMYIGDFKTTNRQVVSIDEIPPRLRNAFIAIEDERFYDHFGIDLIGVLRALIVQLTSGRLQGGSTITQQTARNLLQEIGHERTIARKIREAIASIQIEHRYSKNQILELYLNGISFYNNAIGVKAAAATYFSKDLKDLSVAECALLAALPKAPKDYNPFRHADRALLRRNVVLENMQQLNMIDKKTYQSAKAEPLRLHRSLSSVSEYPFYLDGMKRDLDDYYGIKDLRDTGLRITAAIDPPIQDACEAALREGLVSVERKWQAAKELRLTREDKVLPGGLKENQVRLMRITKVNEDNLKVERDGYHATVKLPSLIPYYEPEKILKEGQLIDIRITALHDNSGTIEGEPGDKDPVQGAMVALDVQTGDVLALVGGTERVIGNYNRAVQGGRQPGSCFKPFVYALAMEKGWGPNSIIIDEAIQFPMPMLPPPRDIWRPQNYAGEGFAGPVTLIQALEESRNVVTVRLFEALVPKKAAEELKKFDYIQNGEPWKILPQLAISLGTLNVSPLQLAAGYQAFANLGTGCRPQFFRSIVDRNGRVRIPRKDRENQIINPVAAAQMQYLMRQVVVQPKGTGYGEIGSKFPSPAYPVICGKTGTTQNNIDAWFAGFTPDIVLVCNIGFNENRSLGPRLTGGKVAGPVWAAAFRSIMKIPGRHWKKTFDAPAVDLEYVNICAKTGKRAGPYCSESEHQIYPSVPFRRGQAPTQACDGSSAGLAPLIAPVGPGYGWEASIALTHGIAQPGPYPGSGTEPGSALGAETTEEEE